MRLPRAIWMLGLVSLLMDVSSEMIHSLLPMFMVTALGASALSVGLIEGLAESTSLLVKVFSGSLSDYFGQRKRLALAGYALSTLTKPLFALAPTLGVVLAARLLDRVGKGVRGAPRDALFAADLALAWHGGRGGVLPGVLLWGVHLGLTQGLLSAMVADAAPADLRGTAFGLFNLTSGGALLLASLLAGYLWDRLGFAATFRASAIFCVLTLLVLGLWRRKTAVSSG